MGVSLAFFRGVPCRRPPSLGEEGMPGADSLFVPLVCLPEWQDLQENALKLEVDGMCEPSRCVHAVGILQVNAVGIHPQGFDFGS